VLDGTGRRTGEGHCRDEAHANGGVARLVPLPHDLPRREGRRAVPAPVGDKADRPGLFDVTVVRTTMSAARMRVRWSAEIAEEIGLTVPYAGTGPPRPAHLRPLFHRGGPGARVPGCFPPSLGSRPGLLRLQASEVESMSNWMSKRDRSLQRRAARGTLIGAEGSERSVQLHPRRFRSVHRQLLSQIACSRSPLPERRATALAI